jgi:CTP:molybdopterin cytidylyltransferase MocA
MIPAVVLAAGLSSRMGRAKALLPLDGETFIERIVATLRAAAVEEVVIVLGHDGESIASALAARQVPARVVQNHEYRSGQFSSVLSALRTIDRPGVEAMLMTLVDVPLVSASTVRAVVDRYHATGAPVVRPVRGDEHGHPVLIARSLFASLRAAEPAQGAKPIVREYASPVGDVHVDDDGAFLDIDTPDEYQRLIVDRR